jgi:hypothetical protein
VEFGVITPKDASAPSAAAAETPIAQAWRRCAVAFMAVFFGGLGLIYFFLLLVDPYDTGRLPTPFKPGVVDTERRTASASRGRDPRFNAAIFGNSRAQMLDPAKLSVATGLSFVSLTTPGSGPREQIAVIRYFLGYHREAEAMVFGIDESWCGHDPALPLMFPFPFWLYRDDLEYFVRLLNTRTFNAGRSRIKLAMGLLAPTDPRGFADYETGRPWSFHPPLTSAVGTAVTAARSADTYFPALEALDALLSELPPQTKFLIMMPPVYRTVLPRSGTQTAADLDACKAGLAARLGSQGIAFLDYLTDGPISRDPENFMDPVHYRLNVAHLIETGIVDALATGAHLRVGYEQ